VTVLLVVLCAVSATWSAVVVANRQGHVATVADTAAAGLYRGQLLRTTVSDADAAAAAMFLTGPDPSPELRDRYDLALAESSRATPVTPTGMSCSTTGGRCRPTTGASTAPSAPISIWPSSR
jgi:hypothetical protein